MSVQNNTALTNLTANNFETVYNDFIINYNPQLLSISFNSLTTYKKASSYIEISNNNTLNNMNFPALVSGWIRFSNSFANSAIISLPSLTTGVIDLGGTKVASFSAPIFFNGSVSITNNIGLTNVSLPNLTTGQITINANPVLASVSFPSFATGSFTAQGNDNSGLTTIDLPNCSSVSIWVTNNPVLTTLNIPNFQIATGYLNFTGNHFPSSQVNSILNKMLTVVPASGKNISLMQTPSAPPTGQGTTDKATLISTGNTVLTD